MWIQMQIKESLSICRHADNKCKRLVLSRWRDLLTGSSLFLDGGVCTAPETTSAALSMWKKNIAVISRSNLLNNLFVSPPPWIWRNQLLFGRQALFSSCWVGGAGRSSAWVGWGGEWGRMLTVSLLRSGKVCIEKNVNADQQERISTAEPGPEHTLSHTGNSGSWSLLWSPHCCDARTDPLTTCHPPSWLRACSITRTEQIQEVTEKITIAVYVCV